MYLNIATFVYSDIDLQLTVTLIWQTKLQKTWNEVRVEDPNKSMLEWLSTFYDVILSTWHTEVHWIVILSG